MLGGWMPIIPWGRLASCPACIQPIPAHASTICDHERTLGRDALLAVSGGIAAYKAPELVRALVRSGCAVRCAMTAAAREFVTPLVLQTLSGERVASDLFDLEREGEIDHIALADWAELLIVAPATANLLAKLAWGLADDLVSTVALATRAPMLVAPAMNVNMWRHPATQQNVATLCERGVRMVGPEVGELGKVTAPAPPHLEQGPRAELQAPPQSDTDSRSWDSSHRALKQKLRK